MGVIFGGKKLGSSNAGSGALANARKAFLGALNDSSSSGVRGTKTDVGGVNRLVGLYGIAFDFGGGGGGCFFSGTMDGDMFVDEIGSLSIFEI